MFCSGLTMKQILLVLCSAATVVWSQIAFSKEVTISSCGTLTSYCRRGEIVFLLMPVGNKKSSASTLEWNIFHLMKNPWKAENRSGFYMFHNTSGYYLIWKTWERNLKTWKKDRDILDVRPSFEGCSFNHTRIRHNDYTQCRAEYTKDNKGNGATTREEHKSKYPMTDKPWAGNKHFPNNGDASENTSAEKDKSLILRLVIAGIGSILLLILISIIGFICWKKKGNKQTVATDGEILVHRSQHAQMIGDEDALEATDTTYSQINKVRESLIDGTLVKDHETGQITTLAQTDDTQHTNTSIQNIPERQSETETLIEGQIMEGTAHNQKTEGELVYIQLDTDHLNKSGTLKSNTTKDYQDTVDYVGVDFANTARLSAKHDERDS